MSRDSQVAGTMPEAKFRSTKKLVRPANAIAATVAMSAVSAPAKKSVEPKTAKPQAKKARFTLVSFWPVAVGIFLSGYVSQWQTMASSLGVWGMRLAFPLTLLATHREIGIDNQMATMLPQIALYAQLPLEGLLTKITLDRGKSLKAALAQLVLVHLVATLVLWLVSFSGS